MKRLIVALTLATMLLLTDAAPVIAEDFYGPRGEVLRDCAYYPDATAISGYRYMCDLGVGHLVPTNPAVQFGNMVWGG